MCEQNITTKTVYVASDGTEFSSKVEAEIYENKFGNKKAAYKMAWDIDPQTLDDIAIWQIYREETENGYGQLLTTVHGTLNNAIDYAIRLPDFYTYGRGGPIVKIVVDKHV